jgi:hypothetical protein
VTGKLTTPVWHFDADLWRGGVHPIALEVLSRPKDEFHFADLDPITIGQDTLGYFFFVDESPASRFEILDRETRGACGQERMFA